MLALASVVGDGGTLVRGGDLMEGGDDREVAL